MNDINNLREELRAGRAADATRIVVEGIKDTCKAEGLFLGTVNAREVIRVHVLQALTLALTAGNEQTRINKLVLAAYPAMDAVDAIRAWCDAQPYENDVITVSKLRAMLPAEAITAQEGRIAELERQVATIRAETLADLTFTLTPIGCGLAGYSPAQISWMFDSAPHNVLLPPEFRPSPPHMEKPDETD